MLMVLCKGFIYLIKNAIEYFLPIFMDLRALGE